uniref:Secreted protein n=1 Tax=Setaria viridis TaxID=4556 RepID=A0A4U6UHE9_SETVI|nr:hypothetical protein SEVIR_5G251450v2 [Setaria viridis]
MQPLETKLQLALCVLTHVVFFFPPSFPCRTWEYSNISTCQKTNLAFENSLEICDQKSSVLDDEMVLAERQPCTSWWPFICQLPWWI